MVIGVASSKLFTRKSDIVHVEFRHRGSGYRNSSELADHGAQERDSENRTILTDSVENFSDHGIPCCNKSLLISVRRVCFILVEGINPAISDSNSVRSHNLNFSVVQVVGDGRDVMSREAFSS